MSANGGEMTVDELAKLCGATVEGDGGLAVTGPGRLGDAVPGEVSFLAQPKYAAQLETTRAAAVLVGLDVEVEREDLTLLRHEDPEAAFTEVILAFAPQIPPVPGGVSPLAHVSPDAVLGQGVAVAEHVSVATGAHVAAGAVLHPGVRIGPHAKVGPGTVLYPGVVLYPYAEVGARCIVHAGTVIGSDGFGFHPVPRSGQPLWNKTPQAGNAVVGDDCEIGANCTIDCARFGSTKIGNGCKLDNLVHVAHNVQVGENTLLLAQVGIAGSTTIGKQVIVAGQAGVTGHVHIGDGAVIMGGAGVIGDVEPGAEMFGYPAGPRKDKMKALVRAQRAGKDIPRLKAELARLRATVEALQERLDSPAEVKDQSPS